MLYTLLLKNNANRTEYVVRGLEDKGTDLLHYFYNFVMPEEMQQGELTYALFIDNTEDPVYNLNDDLLETTVTVAGVTIAVKHLNPEMGMLKYEVAKEQGKFINKNTNNRYYTK